MKELDLLLVAYLDSRYSAASGAEQGAFRELLDMQDPELFAFVTGRERPATEELRRVVDTLRRAP
ncbi:MAG TPA: succinate dehydrogenase assembly factor 2 [Gammaproteobacteria bacterium]|jgi:antitoxin CptB